MTVAATHLSFVPGWNVRQLRQVVRALRALPAPRILLGDLNLPAGPARPVSGWHPSAAAPPTPPPDPASNSTTSSPTATAATASRRHRRHHPSVDHLRPPAPRRRPRLTPPRIPPHEKSPTPHIATLAACERPSPPPQALAILAGTGTLTAAPTPAQADPPPPRPGRVPPPPAPPWHQAMPAAISGSSRPPDTYKASPSTGSAATPTGPSPTYW